MQFLAHEYYQASLDRLSQANTLHKEGKSYALAMYCSGLAVECLLRAFRWEIDRSFDGKHDLDKLLKDSNILCVNEEYMRRKNWDEDKVHTVSRSFKAAISEVAALWRNNFRFSSEEKMRAHLKRIKRDRGIKKHAAKKNSADLVEAVNEIFKRGVVLWESKRRS